MDSNLKDLLAKIKNSNLTTQEKNELKQKTIQDFYQKKAKNIKFKKDKCNHYPNKKCSDFYFECCQKTYECVRCHNENENHLFQLKSITCIECSKIQDVKSHCVDCNIRFSTSFCKSCGLFSEQEHIFHCVQCGLCRVGKEEELIHCNDCNICVLKENHKCLLLGNVKDDYECCFCHDKLYNSMSSIQKLNCCHYAHSTCMQKSIQNNSLKCGLCRKTFLSDIQAKNMWNIIDLEKEQTIIPLYLKIDEIYHSKYGLFVLESKENIEEEYVLQNNEIGHIVSGYLYEWKMKTKVYLNTNDLFLTRKSHCNDCLKTNFNLFHIVGIKCLSCGSYNVS